MSGSDDDEFNQAATVIGTSFEEQIAAQKAKQAEAANADPFGATAIAPSYDERVAAMGGSVDPDPPAEPATEIAGMSYDARLKMMEDNPPQTQVLPEFGGPALPPPIVGGAPVAAAPLAGPEPAPPALVGGPAPPPFVNAPPAAPASPGMSPAPGVHPPGMHPPGAPPGAAPQQQGQWGVARTMAMEGLSVQAVTPAPSLPGAPQAMAPGYAPPVAPAKPKQGLSPVVMMLIGAGAVFVVGALLMALVVGIFLLRGA